jgi:hypothetical protein
MDKKKGEKGEKGKKKKKELGKKGVLMWGYNRILARYNLITGCEV